MQVRCLIKLAVIIIAALFSHVNTSGAQTLRVPYVSLTGNQLPLWIGEKAGLFKKNRLDAQLIYMPGGSLIIQALLSGDVGAASLGPPTAMTAWVKGADLVLIAGGIERLLHVLLASPKIKTPQDLKGKRVGISRFGSLTDIAVREGLRFHKLRVNQDVAIAQIGGTGERVAALTTGVVDGAVLTVDQMFQVEKMGYHVLIDLRKLPFEFPTQGIISRKEFLRDNKDGVKRFLKVYIEGIKILKTDRDFSIDLLRKYLKIEDREVLAKTYDAYNEAFESVPYVNRDGVMRALDSIPEVASKGSKLNPDSLIDNTIIQELEKEGFLRELYPKSSKR